MRTHIEDIFLLKPEAVVGQEPSGDWLTFGFVNGGDIEVNENLQTEKAIGGIVRYYSLVEPSISVDTLITPANLDILAAMIENVQSFTILAGNPNYCVKGLGCFPNDISVECKVGEALKVSVKFEVMKVQLVTPPSTIPTQSGSPILWYDGVVTVDGDNYQVNEFKIDIKRNVKLDADFSPKPSGERRFRNLWVVGLREVECSLSLLLPHTVGLAADIPPPIDVEINLGEDKSIVLTNMAISRRRTPVKGGDDIWVLSLDLVGAHDSVAVNL